MSDVPPERQCTMCDQEAVEPSRTGALCEEHLASVENGGEDTQTTPANPGGDVPETTGQERDSWDNADFTTPGEDTYPEELLEQEKWMGRKGKLPFAPYAERDHPDADPDDDARWKWGIEDNYTTGKQIALAEEDPRLDGRVFIQLEDDPFAFVDGDDVRCPETGEVHPVFEDILNALGATYADVSSSGTGAHAYYRGELPIDGKGQAAFDIDTEPWGENDSPPTVEVYANKHVNVATGEHVPGTPLEVNNWDADALREILQDHGYEDKEPVSHDTDRDRSELENYDPGAVGADDTADDIRDVLHAVDRLRPRDLPLRSRCTGQDSTDWETWDPSYRTSESGESVHRPPGEAVFHDHKEGESFGVLSLFAAEQGIITEPWSRLEGGDWWKAVEAARDAGAPIPQFESDGRARDIDPVAALPSSDDLMDPATGWDWRHAGERATRDVDPVTDARQRTTDTIVDALESGDHALVEALMSLGKSYGAVEAAAETDIPVTILTTRGRKEQYQQIREWCEEHGLSHYTLPAFKRDCDTANGEYGEDWAEKADRWYANAATPQDIHKHAEYHLDRPLPCQEHEEQECPYTAKWRFEADDYDVLIGHPMHSYNDKVVSGRAVMFDEFDGQAFETSFSHRLQSAVSNFLAEESALPFDDYTDLVEGRNDPERRAKGIEWFDENGVERDPFAAFSDGSGHAEAPLAAFTVLAGAEGNLENGWERVQFPNSNRVGTFDRENGRVHILSPPDLDYTKAILALDGTPTREMWEMALGERLNHRKVLTTPERCEYIREGLNLNLVRTSDAVKPYNSDQNVNVDQDAALLEAIEEQHGRAVEGLITTRTALREYENADLLAFDDETREVSAGPAESVNWHGNVHGSNQYAESRLGAVVGSTHYGDGFVKKWGAYAGEAIERGEGRGAELSYGEFGDKVLHHMREHDTLQAAMRFGRDSNGAVVYVHTDTLPDWVPVAGEGRVIRPWSDGMKQVIEAAGELDEWRTAEIAAHPDVEPDQRQVFNILNDLAEDGYVSREWDGRGYTWSEDGLHRVNDHGEVELDPVELDEADEQDVAEIARSSNYTWSFRNNGGDSDDTPATAGDGTSQPPTAPADGADGPPDPGD